MALTEFKAAINQVANDRGITVTDVIDSIKAALLSAYKKEYQIDSEEVIELTVELNDDTGEAKLYKDGKDVTPSGFGRIAAQTAKQVILQKIRETEKKVILDDYGQKLNTIITGTVFRIEPGKVILDLGKTQGLMPQSEQVDSENYRQGQRLKVLIKKVQKGQRGEPEIIVSRSDANFVLRLFEQEVPEISSGIVIIKAIAREAGSRTKMAVYSTDEKIDPVGSCVGQKGVRVQSIINEIYGEKIDVIPYSPVTEKFIAASLSPAKVTDVEIHEDEKRAVVSVPDDQQSLAIGREGQNARLANKLTKWRIDIKGAKGTFTADGHVDESTQSEEKKVVGIWDAAIEKVTKELKQEATPADSESTSEPVAEPTTDPAGEPTSQPNPISTPPSVDVPNSSTN